MNQMSIVQQKRKCTAKLFNNICYVCEKKFGGKFHFHHVQYRNGELKYSDFKSWVQYNEYVLPIIQKIPDKFALLCNTCHRLISILQSIRNGDRFERLVKLARESRC